MPDGRDNIQSYPITGDVAQALSRHYLMSLINNEQDFIAICNMYCELTGRRERYARANDIVADKHYGASYFQITVLILRHTRLELFELKRVMDNIITVKQNEKQARTWRHESLSNNIIAWCRHIDFEPKWHMEKRGDARPLLNIKEKNLWAHLRRLYTDPEYSRVREPDFVKKAAPMYPGYEQCCKNARAQGHAELKRMYGDDVDLTPLVDKRKEDENNMVNLFTALTNGDFASAIGVQSEQ